MKTITVLVTGAAHRVGASIVQVLHEQGANIILHYRNSSDAAQKIADKLNNVRPESVKLISAELVDQVSCQQLIESAVGCFGGLDVLVNNASSFYPTPVEDATMEQWDDLMASNLKAPFFLSQAARQYLAKDQGCIVNIVDIHADRPLKGHSIYCMAKAGLVMMTKSLAKEFGADIRVNAVAPGAILWPEAMDEDIKQEITERTALKRKGEPNDIAKAVLYLVRDANYVTGQIMTIDGGRSLNL